MWQHASCCLSALWASSIASSATSATVPRGSSSSTTATTTTWGGTDGVLSGFRDFIAAVLDTVSGVCSRSHTIFALWIFII